MIRTPASYTTRNNFSENIVTPTLTAARLAPNQSPINQLAYLNFLNDSKNDYLPPPRWILDLLFIGSQDSSHTYIIFMYTMLKSR